jgi:hypothetical protein
MVRLRTIKHDVMFTTYSHFHGQHAHNVTSRRRCMASQSTVLRGQIGLVIIRLPNSVGWKRKTPYNYSAYRYKITYLCSINYAPHHGAVWGTRWRWVLRLTPLPLYPQTKTPRYPLDMRLIGPHIQSGRCGEQKSLAPAGSWTPAAQPVAISTELYF